MGLAIVPQLWFVGGSVWAQQSDTQPAAAKAGVIGQFGPIPLIPIVQREAVGQVSAASAGCMASRPMTITAKSWSSFFIR